MHEMAKIAIIELLALLCIVVSVPISFLVNDYSYTFYDPSNKLTDFIQYLPVLFLAIVLAYGALYIKSLASNNHMKEAAILTAILMVLVLVAIIVIPLTFSFGLRRML